MNGDEEDDEASSEDVSSVQIRFIPTDTSVCKLSKPLINFILI